MNDKIFADCFNKQQESGGKRPYWNGLYAKYKNIYNSKEALRGAYKREKRQRIKVGDLPDPEIYDQEKTSYEEGENFINIICSSKRMRSKQDILEEFNVDMDKWEVERYRVKVSEAYRKDRSVQWEVSDGKVIRGSVDDSGKMLVVPLYHVEVRLARKKENFTPQNIDKFFVSVAKRDYEKLIVKPSQYSSDGVSLLVPIADLHLGLRTTKRVEGNDYNIEIAERYFYDIIAQTKAKVSGRNIKEIFFLVGNDFLNSDNLENLTTRGTPQDSFPDWFHLVDKGIEMIIGGTYNLLELSKVNVINIASNHDRHSLYGIGKVVEEHFRNDENVTVDNRPIYTKYITIGNTLCGFTHDIPKKRALEVITTDAKHLWSKCNHAIWFLAHLHTAMQYENLGALEIYRFPTVAGNSRWASERHFVQATKRSQIFVFDDENGVIDIMNIFVK